MSAALDRHRESILALLEERSYSASELGDVLGLPAGMYQICVALARRGLIRRAGDRWMLPVAFVESKVVESAQPAKRPKEPHNNRIVTRNNPPTPAARLPVATRRQTAQTSVVGQAVRSVRRGNRLGLNGAGADIDRLLAIEEPIAGESVCRGCGNRFRARLGDPSEFCSTRCAEHGPTAAVRTVVADGIEFEALSIGSRPVTGDWAGGSSCTNNTPKLDFRRR